MVKSKQTSAELTNTTLVRLQGFGYTYKVVILSEVISSELLRKSFDDFVCLKAFIVVVRRNDIFLMISTEKRLCGFLPFLTSCKVHKQLVLKPRRKSCASWLYFVSPEMCVRFQYCKN